MNRADFDAPLMSLGSAATVSSAASTEPEDVLELWSEGSDAVRLALPRATQRVQLHRDFDFAAAAAQVPYWSRLGISHLYTSPILKARAGSTHGYDVVDPSQVNPELGGEEGLRTLVATLRRYDMGLIVDIVPNHMAVGRDDNAAWLDVLEWGRDSRYAGFFDIDWDVQDPALHGRVLAPFLGKPYGEALRDAELELRFDTATGRFSVHYYEHRFPLAPGSYAALLRVGGDELSGFARRFRQAALVNRAARGNTFDRICQDFAQCHARDPGFAASLRNVLARFDTAQEEGRGLLHALMERQHWRLAWWRTAADEINWRRFFDVIELAGLRTQEAAVFEVIHATTLRLFAEGLIDGLRVDHVDGLADPRAYCRRLRERLREQAKLRPAALQGPVYLVVEKILAPGERLATDWQVDGTTGYSFMNDVGGLFHDPRGAAPLGGYWQKLSGTRGSFEEEQKAARRRIPQQLLAADFNACAHALHAIARSQPETRDWTLFAIRRALTELLVAFPVYRTYADARGRSDADDIIMRRSLQEAATRLPPGDRPLLEAIDRWLGAEAPSRMPTQKLRRARLRAMARFQQLSSPVAAKSVEDTAFYRHGRLLSRNEVGADPGQFAISDRQFHAECGERARRYPVAMLATATHDHKRGEDLRMRLAVLSEIPDRWCDTVERWRREHQALRARDAAVGGPDPIDEYMLYQMLIGAWPLDLRPTDAAGLAAFCERLQGWQLKAVREAKRLSGWSEPNLEYEQACAGFLKALLTPQRSARFLAEAYALITDIAPTGAINSLSQTALKYSAPGVPDLYQGTEFWDFSLVDPDNRRPVDYEARKDGLAMDASLETLLSGWHDGRIKQQLIHRLLQLRLRWPELFSEGAYLPITPTGARAGHLFGFARQHGEQALIAVVPRFVSALTGRGAPVIPAATWTRTGITLPRRVRYREWYCALTGRKVTAEGSFIPAAALLHPWPVAVFMNRI
jgi:(1->4)-alpha-D-glucan 1-alpha-D-glucosylmutase